MPRLLSDRDLWRDTARRLENPTVRDFWISEFDRYSPAFRAVATAPLQNKLGALLTDPFLRTFLTEDGPQLDLRQMMDKGKALVVNLDRGKIGEGPASTIGSFLLSHLALAGIGRSSQPEADRRGFFVYADEFQTFTTQAVAGMLSELRKYGVGMVVANQHLSQLDPVIRDAVFGNVGTLISFRVGAQDAAYLAREFAPRFDATDLTSLGRHCIYLRLLIDGEASPPFSARTLTSVDAIQARASWGGWTWNAT